MAQTQLVEQCAECVAYQALQVILNDTKSGCASDAAVCMQETAHWRYWTVRPCLQCVACIDSTCKQDHIKIYTERAAGVSVQHASVDNRAAASVQHQRQITSTASFHSHNQEMP